MASRQALHNARTRRYRRLFSECPDCGLRVPAHADRCINCNMKRRAWNRERMRRVRRARRLTLA
jgi:anaerobic ribonucleoside-triphosphate reductase